MSAPSRCPRWRLLGSLAASVVLLSAAVSRIEQRLNGQRRRTGSLGKRGTRCCEIRSGRGHPRGPARPLQNGACANNDLAPRVRGQSKPIKTIAYGLLFSPKIGHFSSEFKPLWAVWFRFFNSRLCAKWSPSLDRRVRGVGNPPPSVFQVICRVRESAIKHQFACV